MAKPKIVIIGAGFGGLNAAQALKKADVEILIIDKTNHHLFQPLLYQVATAALSPSDIAAPIREILSKQKNTTTLLANIVKIEKETKSIISENGERFNYDYLIVAPGAMHSYFDHPEWEAFAPGLKTLKDAQSIRERILLSYERAERCDSSSEAIRFMQFIIIGGGPTGVEMAGAIAEIAHQTLVRDFRNIKPEQTKVFLIEGEGQVLPSYPKHLGEIALKDLKQLGVEVLLKTFVTKVTSNGVWIGNRFLESNNIIWAAGNEAASLLKTLETPLDRNGRVIVNADLSIPDHPEIFVIGDAALSKDENGKPCPGIAPVAIQQGRYVARLIEENIPADKRKPFKYFDKGLMATIGKAKAVVVIGKLEFSGYFAWLTWSLIHIFYLISFPRRILVLIEWFYLYLFNRRGIRLILNPVSDEDDTIQSIDQNVIK